MILKEHQQVILRGYLEYLGVTEVELNVTAAYNIEKFFEQWLAE